MEARGWREEKSMTKGEGIDERREERVKQGGKGVRWETTEVGRKGIK
jgi:hypothetical protein